MVHGSENRLMDGILFDYGGTLVSNREADEILYDILTSLNIKIDRQIFASAFAGMNAYWHERYSSQPRGRRWSRYIMEDCDTFLLESIGLTSNAGETAAMMEERWSAFDTRVAFPDAADTLGAIRDASIKTGVVSQNRMMSSELKNEMESLGIAHLFDTVVTSEEQGFDKPDPGLFLAASSKLEIPPARLFHVGDIFDKDVAGALAAGMTPVLLDRDGTDKSGYVPKIRSLTELVPMVISRD